MGGEDGKQDISSQSKLEIEEIHIETTVKIYTNEFHQYIHLVENMFALLTL